jgi:hypothetical protein
MTVKELQKTETAYWVASRNAEKARVVRNGLVQRAIMEGWTHAQISEATGLSRGRIGQIANSKE